MEPDKNSYTSFISIGLFQIIIVGTLIFSLVNNGYLMSLISILILVLAYGTKIWSKLSMRNIFIDINSNTKRSFPEDSIILSININNNKLLPIYIEAKLLINNNSKTFNEEIQIQSGLISFGKLSQQHDIKLSKRGVYTIGPLLLKSGDLIGFNTVEKTVYIDKEIVIYPKVFTINKFSPESKDFYGTLRANTFIKDPVQIIGTKELKFLGPSKKIHWKSTARTLKIHEKVFESSSHLKIMIVIDVEEFQNKNAENEFEQTLETAASIIIDLNNNNIPVGLILNGLMINDTVPVISPTDINASSWVMLDKLARLNMDYIKEYDKNLYSHYIGGEITYIYFSYSVDEKVIDFYNNKKSVYLITSIKDDNVEYPACYTISSFR